MGHSQFTYKIRIAYFYPLQRYKGSQNLKIGLVTRAMIPFAVIYLEQLKCLAFSGKKSPSSILRQILAGIGTSKGYWVRYKFSFFKLQKLYAYCHLIQSKPLTAQPAPVKSACPLSSRYRRPSLKPITGEMDANDYITLQ